MPLLFPIGLMASAPLLLDGLAAAVRGAWSVRKLRMGFNGYCMRVRRGVDNAELDFGFTDAGNLDTAALVTFCGSGSGFVSKWYDQSGANSDFSQPIASQQPQIVSAGSVLTMGSGIGRPGVTLDTSVNRQMQVGSFTMGAISSYAAAVVARRGASTNNYGRLLCYLGGGGADNDGRAWDPFIMAGSSSTIATLHAGNYVYNRSVGSGAFQAFVRCDGAGDQMWVDGSGGAVITGYVNTLGAAGMLSLGTQGTSTANGYELWSGPVGEAILFGGSVAATDQASVRDSQKTYFGTP